MNLVGNIDFYINDIAEADELPAHIVHEIAAIIQDLKLPLMTKITNGSNREFKFDYNDTIALTLELIQISKDSRSNSHIAHTLLTIIEACLKAIAQKSGIQVFLD